MVRLFGQKRAELERLKENNPSLTTLHKSTNKSNMANINDIYHQHDALIVTDHTRSKN